MKQSVRQTQTRTPFTLIEKMRLSNFPNQFRRLCFGAWISLVALLSFEKSTAFALPPLPPDSLYQLDSQWDLGSGQEGSFAKLRGKPQLLSMIYTTCTGACPILVDNVRKIVLAFEARGRTSPEALLVTFDPERDTRETLDAYAERRGLTSPNWRFVRGSLEDSAELALLIGMKFKEVSPGIFSHSNIILLLDSEGRILHRHQGLKLEDKDIDSFLSALPAEPGSSAP